MDRVYNFSPGPSQLPLGALEKAAQELVNYGSTGMSVMEMSHRGKPYMEIIGQAEALLRQLMNIPASYKVLFLQGGATGMFSAIPMNLLGENGKADYVNTGNFAKVAMKEAMKYGKIREVASSEADTYTYIPTLTRDMFDPDAAYVHITSNNTIFGTRYTSTPDVGNVPLVSDVSSFILSEPIDVSQYGILYAGAQKNIGPAGMCVLIVREDLLGKAQKCCPKIWDFGVQAENESMLNTPPTYTIYMAKLCLEWLREQGGVEAMETRNIEKAALLYDFLDQSKLFKPTAQKAFRSRMNVTFVTGDANMDDAFVKEAAKAGLVTLKGHRIVGGMRASIYNAMPREGVVALVDFMKKFEVQNG